MTGHASLTDEELDRLKLRYAHLDHVGRLIADLRATRAEVERLTAEHANALDLLAAAHRNLNAAGAELRMARAEVDDWRERWDGLDPPADPCDECSASA